jgi:hypothetical protein
MLSCKEVTLLASKALDTRLGWGERLGLRLHLLYCQGCRRFRQQIEFLRQAARRDDAPWADDVRLPEAARTRIRVALRRDR